MSGDLIRFGDSPGGFLAKTTYEGGGGGEFMIYDQQTCDHEFDSVQQAYSLALRVCLYIRIIVK